MQFPAVIELSALAGSDGFVMRGASANHLSGWSVGDAGDVNGDGIGDLVIGAPAAQPHGFLSGASFVVFGRSEGFDPVLQLSSLDGSDGFVLNGATVADSAGSWVSAAGDVNGDGIDDLIVSAHGAGPDDSGRAYVVYGRTGGFAAEIELSSLDGSTGFAVNGASAGDAAGRYASAAGDVNGDGIDDLIIGSYAGANASRPGFSHVVFGRSDGFPAAIDLSSLDGGTGFVINAPEAQYAASAAVVDGAGDLNGDGIDDLVIGTPRMTSANGLPYSGQSYVVFGRTGGFDGALDLSALDGGNGFQLNGGLIYDNSGRSVSAAGDVNADGIGDLVIGAPSGNDNAGRAYVLFGRTAGFAAVIELSSLDGEAGFVLEGAAPETFAGFSVSAAGDVNGDGIDDLIVGSYASPNGPGSGASYVVFGRTGGFGAALALSTLDGSAGFVLNGASAYDAAVVVSGAGDVNGDGVDDLVVGAKFVSVNGQNDGASYVVFGRPQTALVTAISTDTGTVGDGVTTDNTLTVSGTATLGATVHVFRGAAEIGTASVAADGTWSFADPATLSLGPHVYRAQAEAATGTLGPKSEGFEAFVVNPAALPTNGNDAVLGSAGANLIQGGNGNDTLFGEAGNDSLKGNNGNDWLYGGDGSDRLEGENGNDVGRGGNGDDTVYGQNGKDTLSGDNGNDRLEGGADADSMNGGAGADTMYGGAGTDTLLGGAGGDRLYGDADPDWIDLGDDTSRDTVFGSVAHLNEDTIDGFVGGAPATPGADLLLISGLTNAQAKKLDGDLLDEDGVLSLAEVGGGSITFGGHGGATVDAVFTAGGVQVWLV